jgi:hypothetical protein
MSMSVPSLRHGVPLLAAAALMLAAGLGAAQAQTAGAAAPRPAFCITNQVNGVVTAEIKAGKAATQVQLPPGQEGCCVKFCSENAAPAGYQVAIMAQPPGGISHQLCKATVKKEQMLDVIGTLVEGQCNIRALP